jgi:hypothetical protein
MVRQIVHLVHSVGFLQTVNFCSLIVVNISPFLLRDCHQLFILEKNRILKKGKYNCESFFDYRDFFFDGKFAFGHFCIMVDHRDMSELTGEQ